MPGFFQVNVPAQGFAQDVWGVATNRASGVEIFVQRIAIVRMHAVVDDHPCALPWRQATQVGEAHFGHEDVDVVLGVTITVLR